MKEEVNVIGEFVAFVQKETLLLIGDQYLHTCTSLCRISLDEATPARLQHHGSRVMLAGCGFELCFPSPFPLRV